MKVKATPGDFKRLLKVFHDKGKFIKGPSRFIVGYKADYAIFVHENLEAHHPVGKAKFLEQPMREMGPQLAREVAQDVANGMPLKKALLKAGMKLQAASQKLCPVETGNLRSSAFTRVE